MDIVCIIGGAILLALSGIAPESSKGTVKGIGITVLIIGLIWFLFGFIQGFNSTYYR